MPTPHSKTRPRFLRRAAAVAFACGLLFAAPAARASATESTKSGEHRVQLASKTASASTPAPPAAWGPLQIVVYKSKRTLAVYRFGVFDREYPVVLGANPHGRKRFMYDARTPEGYYHISDKRTHERWQYFLALDYPNARDRQIYRDELERGLIPREDDGSPFKIGGSVGIHGNDKPGEQENGVNWTQGCIAMRRADIAEIFAIVSVGTPVWVVE